MNSGAAEVHACVVHADFAEDVAEALAESVLKSILVTDTIPIRNSDTTGGKIEVCSTGPILAEAIRRIHSHESVSALFS